MTKEYDDLPEYYDCVTLARAYDTSRDEIKRKMEDLRGKGYRIEVLRWGKQGKLKVNGKQFRKALLRECGEGTVR